MFREHQERKFLSVLLRLVNLSEMKLHLVTLLSEHESLNRWNLNSSVNQDTDLEWFAYWKDYCVNFLKNLGIKDDEMRIRDHEQEELMHITVKLQVILNSFSHSVGVSFGYC